ncbi:MAG TPA: ABC transporter permease [Chitinophagaceae bacterium]|nr:ABC transporter permease [Chitinophagaceae bacterium]
MSSTYSQSRALWAITKASFKAIFTNPAAIFFSLMFPIIFVLIFGAFGNGGGVSYRIAIGAGSDTNNVFYERLRDNPSIRIVSFPDSASLKKELQKGRLTAIVTIKEQKDSAGRSSYSLHTNTTTASGATIGGFMEKLEYLKLKYEMLIGHTGQLVNIERPEIASVRRYRQIDFVLPGQLGFSILFSTLFGVAFTFFGLRETLVLKRFYASPVSRLNILLGIGISRIFFQLLSVIVLLLFGHFVLNFTLQHGILTFFEIVFMTIVMLFLLLGVGLIFSSIVKTDTAIPLIINLFGFPQMMLSGTFFPIEVFPGWLQEICRVLPLTQYNDAVRKISFEGLHLSDCLRQLGILGIWIAIIYIILMRVLKWE